MQSNIIINVIDSSTIQCKFQPKISPNIFPDKKYKIYNLDISRYLEITDVRKLIKIISDAAYDKAAMKSKFMPGSRIWLLVNAESITEDPTLLNELTHYIKRRYNISTLEKSSNKNNDRKTCNI